MAVALLAKRLLTPQEISSSNPVIYIFTVDSIRKKTIKKKMGWVPWSSGYGRRLMFDRMWVRILVLHTVWTYFFRIDLL